MKLNYKSRKNRGRTKIKRNNKTIYKIQASKKQLLIIPIVILLICSLYFIIPRCLTITVGIDEYKRDELKDIIKEVIAEQTINTNTNTNTTKEEELPIEEPAEEASVKPEVNQVTSRGSSSIRQSTTKLTGYRITSYYPGDNCASGTKTGSGKTINDFKTMKIGNKSVYTYNGKVVVAAATKELKNTGYSMKEAQTSQPDKHYFKYYDTLSITIDGNTYEAIVLDSCGAAMWKGYYRIDLFVPSSSNVIDRNNVNIQI